MIMKTVLSVVAATALSPMAFGAFTTTQSDTQTIFGSGSEDFETSGWSDPGIADVFSIVEIGGVQQRVAAEYGDWWTADGDDLEARPAADAFINIIGIEFVDDIQQLNLQVFSEGGQPPWGGTILDFFLDGNFVGNTSFYAAWTDNTQGEWVTIGGTANEVFDEVRIYHYVGGDTAYIDNMTWQSVPTPGALALLGLAGVLTRRHR